MTRKRKYGEVQLTEIPTPLKVVLSRFPNVRVWEDQKETFVKKSLLIFSFILVFNSCGLSEEEIIRQKEIDEEEARYDRIEKEFKDNYNLALHALIKGYEINDIYTDNTDLSKSLQIEEITPIGIYFTDIFPENKKFDNVIKVTGDEFVIKKAELLFQKASKKKFLIARFSGELSAYNFNNNLFTLNVYIRSNIGIFANHNIALDFGKKYKFNQVVIHYDTDNDYFILKNLEKLEYKIPVLTEEAKSFKNRFSSVYSIVLFRIGKTQVMEDFKEECTKRLDNRCIVSKKINIKKKLIELIPERNIYFSRWEREDARVSDPYVFTNIKYKE